MYPRPVISNSTTCGKGADTWRTPTPAHIGAAPSRAARTKPPASGLPQRSNAVRKGRCGRDSDESVPRFGRRASTRHRDSARGRAGTPLPWDRMPGRGRRADAGRAGAASARKGARELGEGGVATGAPGSRPRRPPGPVRMRDPSRSRGTQQAADASWRVRRRDGGAAAGRLPAAELGSQAGAYARRSRFGAEGAWIQGAGASALCFDARAGIGQCRDRAGTAVAVAWRRICSARLSTTKKAQPRAGP